MSESLAKLQKLIDEHHKIVFFGGAGVSTESGIPDFRSVDGLYHQSYALPPETIISHSYFVADPLGFYKFYREKMLFLDAKPNAAHYKLAEMEQAGRLTCVVTQNIDGLHQKAGSKRVEELHGSVHRNYCMRCGRSYDVSFIKENAGIPTCSCGGIIKPDVVLYEEGLDQGTLKRSIQAISQADLLIVGGTSLAVYPAAGLLQYFQGDDLVIINRSPTPADHSATLLCQESIGELMGQLVTRQA